MEAFAAQAETEVAQLWLARMRWPQGHEKMVTFGQNIGVPGNVKGLWCYKAELDAVKAVYTGLPMTWELRAAPFPFAGDMGSDNCQFTIDFQRDTALKENINIHADMGAYNAAHNAEKAARRTAKRFADLTGDSWTTAELHAQGFTDRNIRTFCKDGLIKKLYQGRYQRVSK